MAQEDVKRWIRGDESAKEMLARVFQQRPLLHIPPLHRVPLRVGNIVEVIGPSLSAKTQILLQVAVNCILPKEWNGVNYGGLEHIVMFVDLDCRFDVLRLAQVLKHRIMKTHGSRPNAILEQGDNIFSVSSLKDPSIQYDQELFAACMRRFLYIRCYDSSEFLATLKTLHSQLQKERERHTNNIYFLMIDRGKKIFKHTLPLMLCMLWWRWRIYQILGMLSIFKFEAKFNCMEFMMRSQFASITGSIDFQVKKSADNLPRIFGVMTCGRNSLKPRLMNTEMRHHLTMFCGPSLFNSLTFFGEPLLLKLNSIGAFYWIDRASASLAAMGSNRITNSLQIVFETIVEEIRKLMLVHPMLVLAAKTANLEGRYPENKAKRTNVCSRISKNLSSSAASDMGSGKAFPYREYMPSPWQSFVTHRVLVHASDDGSNHRDQPVYVSRWILPSLCSFDKFIVEDAGIYTIQ